MRKKIIIGSRGSKLALLYAQKAKDTIIQNVISHKKIIGVIPARMKSSRFYGKPLKKIRNKEMISYVYDNTINSILDEVYVATDHVDILNYCKVNNINCMMTSEKHKNLFGF